MTVRVLTQDITTGRQTTFPKDEDVEIYMGDTDHDQGVVWYNSSLAERIKMTSLGYRRQERWYYFEDFDIPHSYYWISSAASTGTSIGIDYSSGVRRQTTAATLNDYIWLYQYLTDFARRNDAIMWEARIRVAPTGTAADYYCLAGVDDINDTQSHRAYFIIDTGTSATNWITYTQGGGSATQTTSGTAFAANTWYTLRIEMTSTQVEFFIDGTSIATHTTNLPGGTTNMAQGFYVQALTAAAKSMDVDYAKMWGERI